jgi:exopolyphosphatase/guanosine-5'-triphosphate,3'-diphosphate pyrophosphatase
MAATLAAVRLADEAAVRTNELAVIDLGSNTARLAIFETTRQGGFRSVFESKEVPRLGKGIAADGSLSADAMERGVDALRRFARQIHQAGRPLTLAVATSAVRDAPNGPDFLSRVARETGVRIRVLSGTEEGRYGYLGVAGAFELGRDLIVDLGGGSLQAALTQSGRLDRVVSLRLGALRLTQQFLRRDPPRSKDIEALRDHVREELEEIPLSRSGPSRVYGVGGTIRCLARVAIELFDYPLPQVHGYPLSRDDLASIDSLLSDLPADRRRSVPGISGHRADVISAGLVVVEELMRRTGQETLWVSGTGIREGLALEHMGAPLPAPAELLAYRSVTAMARAFGFSLPHGEEVRRVALELFDLLRTREKWGREERLSLCVGAWMHDAGTVVEIWRHPRHSAYILRHASVFGLTQRELLMASLVVYLHEGDEPPETWKKAWRPILGPEDLRTARRLGTILFFAETLDGAQVSLHLPRQSSRLHLRVSGGPGSEASEKAVDRLKKSMQRTFDLQVVFHAG